MVVAILHALMRWLKIPLGEYEVAELAFKIERQDVGLSGGKQDQFASAFGGFNFMEFHKNNQTIVNPLRISGRIVNELQSSLLLYFTGVSRDSGAIINDQIKTVLDKKNEGLDSMHAMKKN
jgi:D-glycero-alpha-D-manno-heptose-7-phosphate kinase